MEPTVGGVGIKVLILLVLGLFLVVGILIVFAKRRRKRSVMEQPVLSPKMAEHYSSPEKSSVEVNIKRCPTCHSTYTDETLRYCLIDGASLEGGSRTTASYDPEATIRINNKGDSGISPTVQYHPEMQSDKDKG